MSNYPPYPDSLHGMWCEQMDKENSMIREEHGTACKPASWRNPGEANNTWIGTDYVSNKFDIKDSGKRQTFASGMQRDTQEGKVLWHLVASGPMLQRWANHLTSGAVKYNEDNWMLANGKEEEARFKKSAFRHFMQWYNGDRDEDHGAAVFFNINGAEYVRTRMEQERSNKPLPDCGKTERPLAGLLQPTTKS